MGRVIDIYGGKDPRGLPRYSTAEAAHYLRLPRATLKTWVHGRVDPNGHRAEAIIQLPGASPLLSFQNLVEAHVLGAIRRHHGVSLQRVRKALRFVERRMHLSRPLITAKFRTNGMAKMEGALRASLARVERDADGLASRLFPFIRGEGQEPKVIVVDPRLSFGRPVVAKTGVPVSIIVGCCHPHDAIRTAIPAAA